MPEFLSSLPVDGVGWIALGAFLGGLARGFVGFGGALIFLPISAQYLSPFWAITVLAFMEILGPIPTVAQKWRAAEKGDLWRLIIGAAVCLPIGLMILTVVPEELFQYAVCLVSIVMLIILSSGFRYRGQVSSRMVMAIGGAGGLLGGLTGQPGPPVIISYMARPLPAKVIRANMSLFLLVYDVLVTGFVFLLGKLALVPVVLGLVMSLPNMAGNMLGGWLFRPQQERVFRAVAYVLIGGAALSGLPFWG